MHNKSQIKRGAFLTGGFFPAAPVTTLSLDADPPSLERLADERDALTEKLADIRRRVAELRAAQK